MDGSIRGIPALRLVPKFAYELFGSDRDGRSFSNLRISSNLHEAKLGLTSSVGIRNLDQKVM